MELEEAFLFMAGIVAMILFAIFFEKYLSVKAKLAGQGILVVVLSGMSTFFIIERFSYSRLIIAIVFIITGVYQFYRNYKKYKKEICQPGHSSSVE